MEGLRQAGRLTRQRTVCWGPGGRPGGRGLQQPAVVGLGEISLRICHQLINSMLVDHEDILSKLCIFVAKMLK